MSVTVNYAGNAAGLWVKYILSKWVPALRDNTVLAQYAEPATLPRGKNSLVARWNRMDNLVVDTTALEEASATDNEITEVTVTAVESTISSYGQWMKMSDLAKESIRTSDLDQYVDTFKYAGLETIDDLIFAQAVTTTGFMHSRDTAASGATMESTCTLVLQDCVVAGELLRVNKAKGFPSLNNRYFVGVTPNAELDMVTDVTTTRLSWSNVMQHTQRGMDQIINKNNGDFVGQAGRVVIGVVDSIDTVTEDVAAYRNVALGRWGLGWLGFGKSKPDPEIIIKTPGSQDTSNPLNQYGTIGWKIKCAQALLHASRVFVVYSAE